MSRVASHDYGQDCFDGGVPLVSGWVLPEQYGALRRHTADATAAAKRDAGAIARGVAEGLARKGPLDINAASATELQTLPGMTPELAGRSSKHRPYGSTRDLVRKPVLSSAEYDRVKGQIFLK